MSHYKIYVVKNANDKEDYAGHIDEETMFDEVQHFANCVEEVAVTETWKKQFKYDLDQIFGPLNVNQEEYQEESMFTIFRPGAVLYFETMRKRLLSMAQAAMARPIEDFVKIDIDHPGWYLIREMLDSNYDSHFYVDGYGCLTRTQFVETILWIMKNAEADSVTLELRQVFDFHV